MADGKSREEWLTHMRRTEQRILEKSRKKSQPKFVCNCRNHLGKPKHPHKTRQDALDDILRNHINRGPAYTVYQCPTSDRFHVATKKEAGRA